MIFVRLDGGTFRMGSDEFYPEEGPVHEATVGPFEIGRYAVTNDEFAAFVAATGYVTVAERVLDPASFPGAQLDNVAPGSLVFTPTSGPVDLRGWRQWWRWVPGASWRHPYGPDSDLAGHGDHSVVQVAFPDAAAYVDWAGGRLPTEAEWEFAARGGLDGATFAWGEKPNDGLRANTWQGRFPYRNDGARGWVYTAPVGSFPANGFGLYEMSGNTWEWTSTVWRDRHTAKSPCCAPDTQNSPTRVLKGGSHLCSPEYCLRYRPARKAGARHLRHDEAPAARGRPRPGGRLPFPRRTLRDRAGQALTARVGGRPDGRSAAESGSSGRRRRRRWNPWGIQAA